jgi:hypothetical protein
MYLDQLVTFLIKGMVVAGLLGIGIGLALIRFDFIPTVIGISVVVAACIAAQ